jgi:hypothetical protein
MQWTRSSDAVIASRAFDGIDGIVGLFVVSSFWHLNDSWSCAFAVAHLPCRPEKIHGHSERIMVDLPTLKMHKCGVPRLLPK